MSPAMGRLEPDEPAPHGGPPERPAYQKYDVAVRKSGIDGFGAFAASTPSLHYWKPASLEVMNYVRQWRMEGIPVCYTVDAGPNIHVICTGTEAQMVEKRLREIMGVENVLVARPGGPAKLVANGS